MSSTDKRIVILEFDNASFEAGVAQSLVTLKNLEGSVSSTEENVNAALSDLTRSVNGISFSNITDQAEHVSSSFSALQAVAFGVFATIGSKVEELGEKLVKNLGVDNMLEGWNKYNQEISSVQMMVNAGYDLDTVEHNLAKLMTFADETSYDYSSMVDAIAKFTTYDLDLSDSTRALEGFNAAAALMGVNAGNAQHALSGLVGGMAQGYLANNNWKWFSTAKMTGTALTSAFIEAGEALGTLERYVDEETGVEYLRTVTEAKKQFDDVSTKNFASTLSSQWLSNDVIMKALNGFGKYMDDIMNLETVFGMTFGEAKQLAETMQEMSGEDWGWTEAAKAAAVAAQEAKTWEEAIASVNDAASSRWMFVWKTIIGNYDEAKILFTDLANYLYEIFVDPIWFVSDAIAEWKDIGGRKFLFDQDIGAFYYLGDAIKSFLDTVSNALSDIFPILATTEKVGEASESFMERLSGKILEIQAAYQEEFNTVPDYLEVLYEAYDQMGEGAGEASDQALLLFDITTRFQARMKQFSEFIESHADDIKSLTYAIVGPLSVIWKLAKGLKEILKAIFDNTLGPAFKGIVDVILNITKHFGNLVKRINTWLDSVTWFKDAAKAINDFLAPVRERIEKISEGANKGIDAFTRWLNIIIDLTKESKDFGDFFGKVTDTMKKKGGGWSTFADVLEHIKSIIDKVWPVVRNFGSNIGTAFNNIKDAISKVFGKKETGVETFGQRVSNSLKKINDSIEQSETGKKIKAFFDNLGESIKNIDWVTILEKLSKAWENFKKVVDKVWSVVKVVWGFIKDLFGQISDYLRDFWNTYMGGKSVTQVLVEGGAFALILKIIDLINDIKKKGAAGPLGTITEAVVNTFKSLQGVLTEYQNTIKADILKKIAVAVAILAGSVIALSLVDSDRLNEAIAILGFIFTGLAVLFAIIDKVNIKIEKSEDSTFKWENIVNNLANGVNNFLNKIATGIEMNMLGSALMKVAAAIAIIAGAVYIIGKLNTREFIQGIEGLGIIVAALMAAMAAMFLYADNVKDIFGKKTKAIGQALEALSVSILILSLSIKILAKIDAESMYRGLDAILAMLAAMGMIVILLGKYKEQDLAKVAGTVMAFGLTMNMFAIAAKIIATISWPDLGKFGAILVGFGVSLAIFSKFVDGSNLGETALAIMTFGAAMVLVSFAATKIAKISWEGIGKFAVTLLAFSSILAGVSHVMGTLDTKKSLLPMLAFVGVMSSLVIIVKAFSLVSWDDLLKAGAALAGFASIMVGIGFALKGMGAIEERLKGFGMAAAGLGILVAGTGVGLLAFAKAIDILYESAWKVPKILVTIAEGLAAAKDTFKSSAAALISGLIEAFLGSLVAHIPQIGDALLNLIISGLTMIRDNLGPIIDLVMDIISMVLDKLTERAPEIVEKVFKIVQEIIIALAECIKGIGIKNLGILAGAFVAFGAMLYFLGKNREVYQKSLVSLGIMILAMASIAAILGVLTMFDSGKLLKAAISLTMALLAFTAMTAVLTIIGNTFGAGAITGALYGIAAMGIVIAGVGVIIAATYGIFEAIKAISGGATDMAQIIDTVNQLGDLLGALATAIGKFFGGLVAGFAMEALPAIGAALSAFMDAFQPFINGAKNIDDSTIKGVECLVAVLLALSVAELIDAFAHNPLLTFGGGRSFTDLANDLVSFAAAIVGFTTAVSVLSENDLNKTQLAADAAVTMATFANAIPRTGGILQDIIGEKDMDDFGKKMMAFIAALGLCTNYIRIIGLQDSDVELFNRAAAMGTAMAELAKSIPRSGGWLQKIIGEQDIGDFGNKVQAYIRAINLSVMGLRFMNIADTDVELFDRAATMGKAMSDLAETIPRTGGIVQELVGEKDLGDFGEKVKTYIRAINMSVNGLRAFGLSDDDVSMFKMAADVGHAMSDLAQTIPLTGGFFEQLIGTSDIGVFGEKVKAYITAITEAYHIMRDGGLNATALLLMACAAGVARILSQDMPTGSNFIDSIFGKTAMDLWASKLIAFGNGIADFSQIVKGRVNLASVLVAAIAGEILIALAKDIPEGSGVLDWLFGGSKDFSEFSRQIVDFGAGIAKFSDKVSGKVDPNAVNIAVEAGEMMAALAKDIPDSSGVLGWLFGGKKDLGEFGDQLASFGDGIAKFSESVRGKVDPTSAQVAALAGEIMATLAKDIPDSTGVIGWLFGGTKDLGKFGNQLKSFGEGIADFSSSVTGKVDPNAVDTAADAAGIIAALAEDIPVDKGLIGKIFGGSIDFETFGAQMPYLANGIVGFANIISKGNIDTEAAKDATDVIVALANINLPEEGSFFSKLFGKSTMDFGQFGKKLKDLGQGLIDYNGLVTGVDFQAGIDAVKAAATMVTDVKTIVCDNDLSILKTIGNNLKNYGSNFKSFVNSVSGADTTNVEQALSSANTVVSSENSIFKENKDPGKEFKDLGDRLADFGTAYRIFYLDIKDMDKDKIETALSEFRSITNTLVYISQQEYKGATNFPDILREVATTSIEDFCNAFKDGKTDFETALFALVSDGVKALQNLQFRWIQLGKYNVNGYIEGMKSKNQDVYNAAYQLGKTALDATARATLTQSPSKEFSRLGMYNDVGYANGMLDNIQVIRNAGDKLGSESIAIMSKSVDKIMSMMDSDMDMQPVIRPVFDSSNIRSGISEVNRMYSGMAIGSGMSYALSSNVQSGIRNTGDSQLVSAINDLKRTITSNPTNTYNVNGITYDDGSTVSNAISALIGAITVEGRM